MADFNLTASAASRPAPNTAEMHVPEAFVTALTRGLKKVWKREFAIVEQGLQFFREESIKQESATYHTYRGMGGLVPQNRDADDIPYGVRGDGFSFTVQTYNYRRGVAIEKTLMEVDDVGVIRGLQSDLARSAKLTKEYVYADVINRALGATAPILADDGMFLIDSDRPNADVEAGTWSNLESTGALSETMLFAADLNARQMTGEDGELYPQTIKKLVIRPDEVKSVWKLLNTQQVLNSSINDWNWAKSKFSMNDVITYDYMTTSQILYLLANPKSDDNELYFFTRVPEQFLTWVDGSNPDVTRQRVRMAWGLGLGSPRKFIRGGALS